MVIRFILQGGALVHCSSQGDALDHYSSQGDALVHCSSQGDALCYFFRPFRAVMGGID